LKSLPLAELIKLLEERIKTQKEAHNGGSKWIGRADITFGISDRIRPASESAVRAAGTMPSKSRRNEGSGIIAAT